MGWGKFSNLNKICSPFPVRKGLIDYMSDPLVSTGMREIWKKIFRKRVYIMLCQYYALIYSLISSKPILYKQRFLSRLLQVNKVPLTLIELPGFKNRLKKILWLFWHSAHMSTGTKGVWANSKQKLPSAVPSFLATVQYQRKMWAKWLFSLYLEKDSYPKKTYPKD